MTSVLAIFFFFGYVSSGKGNKSKNKCMVLHQSKSFWTMKETLNKMKRPPTEWEKIFANDVSDELISKIYKELIQLNIKKTTQLKNGQKT